MRLPALLRLLGCALMLVPAACSRAPAPASHVALWAISIGGTPRGWIMGTIHALPPGTHWRRAPIDAAMAQADRLVMEIGEPLNPQVAGQALARLALTPGLPAPSARLDPGGRAALFAAYRKLGLDDARFQNQESWAVALQISAIATQRAGADAGDGVEPQLRAGMPGKPVVGLETIDSQFAVFDALPDRAQQRLLAAVAHEVIDPHNDDADTLALWLKGDDLGLTREASSDFLADPVLHDALLTARDKAWTAQIDTMLRSGARPFIAVGAAHVAGRDGLPEMLRAKGWTVTRVY
ncbi:TraB/GumN family protein [Novosphingobium acidiphilum]|uniref:TraB/GumN family protein n=1 Tax=Novosphingobium acidiphilum TaxID=505248 RepID=UPI00048D1F27|nr:TraB/GumN family protein [Novosphingobium acidiphilum]